MTSCIFSFFVLLLSISAFANPSQYYQPFKPYYSQCGQDKFIDQRIFKKRKKRFFVDIGAHDGISYSNTYFFEKERGWKGICIEPHPERFKELVANRTAKCFNCCISDVDVKTEMAFLKVDGYPEMLSGLIDKYDKRHFARVLDEIKKHGGSYEIINVETRNFAEVLFGENQFVIDLLSIDTEGNELDILKSIPFDEFRISVITVENNFNNDAIQKFLQGKGYRLVKQLGGDEIYVRKKSK